MEIYGVEITKAKMKPDAYAILEKLIRAGAPSLALALDEFLEDDPNAEFEDFVDEYENDTYLWGGFYGLLTDFLNEAFLSSHSVKLEYDDGVIGVTPYIPVGTPGESILTQRNVQEIFARWLNKFLEEPATITWFE